MRYGRDYGNNDNRSWLDRAGEKVGRWFGGDSHDYGRDYGYRGGGMQGGMGGGGMNARDWHPVRMHPGSDRVRYVERYDRDFGGGGSWGGSGYGGYGYGGGGQMMDRGGYDAGYRGGMGGGMQGGMGGYGEGQRGTGTQRGFGNGGYGGYGYGTSDRDLQDNSGWSNRGYAGGNRGGMQGASNVDDDDWGRGATGAWGDYTSGSMLRGSNSGGVPSGQHFRGYGHGSHQNYGPGW